jgi:hypothetical protein
MRQRKDKRLITPDSLKKFTNWQDFLSEPQLQLRLLMAEKARRSLKEFVIQAWPILEPQTEFVEGIHVDAICSLLQAATERRIGNLIINVPPGHAKSLLTAVFWPAWVWIDHPESRWFSAAIVSRWLPGTASDVGA